MVADELALELIAGAATKLRIEGPGVMAAPRGRLPLLRAILTDAWGNFVGGGSLAEGADMVISTMGCAARVQAAGSNR